MKNAKILLVDDDPDVVVSIKAILENQQYRVVTASNKEEGQEKLASEKPDLIILDVMMETKHDGFEMSREIRSDPQFDNMPILMLTSIDEVTGVNFKAAMVNKEWLPADGYLDKPVEPKDLLSEIEDLLAQES